MRIFWLSILLIVSASACAQQQQQGPGGAIASCSSVLTFSRQHVNYTPDSVVFNVKLSEWTPDTVIFLKGMADSCGQAKRIRQDFIDQAKTSIDEVATVPEKRRLDDEKKTNKEIKMQRLEVCESTNESALYNAQEAVISDLEQIAGWKENQAKERRIAMVSGVRDLLNERNNGAWIVEITDGLKNDFAEYKRLGGKAKSPKTVTHKLSDPCADLREPIN